MKKNKKTFRIIYLLAFFTSIGYALPLYIQSSFLQQFSDTKHVGLYITIATALTLLAIFIFPQFIKKYHNYRVMFYVVFLYILSSLFLISSKDTLAVLLFFSLHTVAITLIGINLDVFLEDISDNRHAGEIRTKYLTVVNTAILLSPYLMGMIVGKDNNYALAYIASAFMIFLTALFLFIFKKNLHDHVEYKRRHLVELWEVLKNNANLTKVFGLSLLLRFFFAIMVLYTPLYLHDTLGFSWQTIGAMLTIMLLPYVFLELPAGYIADKFLGEKELLVAGMIIMVVFTGSLVFISSKDVILWTGVLFFTRVGAALLESMQEVYFFKIVNREDVDIINLFRDTHPAGWLLASAMSVLILKLLPIVYLFLILAVIILLMIPTAMSLEDTK